VSRPLPGHGRYAHSAIVDRPVYEWPNGTRLAIYLAMNVEAFAFGEGKGAGVAPPEQALSQSTYSWRDYGNRVGFWRLMDLFDALELPCEHQLNVAVYDQCPDVVARIRSRGDEILGHGITNSEEQGGLDEEAERALIGHCTEVIARHEGTRPAGWMSPWLSNSDRTLDLLQEAGYRYVMDWTCDDQPVWARTRSGRILLMPYPIETNDNRALVWYRYSSQEFADMLVDTYDEMREQAVAQPLVMPVSLHPFVVGRPYRLRQLRRALAHIASDRAAVWITRPGDICRHVESLPAGTVPGG
jgi:peptidoglycan/xylan/chitin deacetylase (PgdA/CDA1 family)